MALTLAFLDAHIASWEERLKYAYPHRTKWPSRLFHHSPIENAVSILQQSCLRSRLDSDNWRSRDVAGAVVIATRQEAHSLVRLYFRPRTPTQWHIEGIKKSGECKFGDEAHAPVLVMFVLDARRVLQMANVSFSDRNMQIGGVVPGRTETEFAAIPFDKVYHEGGTGGDHSITQHRCAEVLLPSPLLLDHVLQWICCRSNAEKETLLHLLGSVRQKWAKKIIVSDDLRVFERCYAFVEEVNLSSQGLVFEFNPRLDMAPIQVQIQMLDAAGGKVIDFTNPAMSAVPDLPKKRWIIKQSLPDGNYAVSISIEGHLAYRNSIKLESSLF